jgi:two-component system, chemotaxis family, chemotaxis protein CheY
MHRADYSCFDEGYPISEEEGTMTKTVLIVDDAAVIRQLLSFTLKGAGYKVIEAINGQDALIKAADSGVEMVITDLNMPEMDGIEFIKQLRGKTEYKFTPIIMLTTVSQEEKKQEGKKAGASGWVYKPFNSRQLMDMVKKFIV